MGRLLVVFVILIVLPGFSFAQNTPTQQDATPLLLIQQDQVPSVPPPVPGVSPTSLATSPPPPCPAGIPVVQTIPTQTLLTNLPRAVITAKKLNKLLTPGKVWIMRAPAGEIEIKGGVFYQGVVVAFLRFNPIDGSIYYLLASPPVYTRAMFEFDRSNPVCPLQLVI